MKSVKPSLTILALAALLPPAGRAQFGGIVFDPTQSAHAIEQIEQGVEGLQTAEQIYTTSYQTMQQVIATYNLAYQMSQMPQDLAARYKADFSLWTNLSATPNTYGNTAALVNALNLGGLQQAQQGYNSAFFQAQNFPSGTYSSLDANTQAIIANQYATSELAQTATTGTLSTLGTIRSDSEAFAAQLSNLESDTFSTDPNQQTENALLGKINSATLLQLHSQQDANQLLAASIQQQLIAQKQQIDAQNRAIDGAIYFAQNFPTVIEPVTSGVSDAMHNISLSTTGQ
jgi:hypothetical protein